MGSIARRVSGLALVAIALCGCSAITGGDQPVRATSGGPSASSTSGQPRSTTTSGRNDLKSGSAKRTFRSGRLTVEVQYSSSLPMAKWVPGVAKPLNVSVTAFVNSTRAQKIYLARVRADISAKDGADQVTLPDPLVDTANITPGFIVTYPYTYVQVFVIPAVDDSATSLNVSFSYEFLVQATPLTKDYSKQTARDSLTIALR